MVIFAFWLGAMLLTLVALALLLPPLLRRHADGRVERQPIERELARLKRRHHDGEIDDDTWRSERERLSQALVAAVESETSAPATARTLAIVLLVTLPVAAIALYFAIGRPDALDARARSAANTPAMQMGDAIAALEHRLREHPDDIEGWLLLARSYRSTERFADMLRATSSALTLATQDPAVMVEHAEALALNSGSRQLDGEPRALLERALEIDANQQKALWLLGVAELQGQRPAAAVGHWQRLRALLPADDPIRASLDQQIAAAQAGTRMDIDDDGNAQPPAPEAGDPAGGPQITVSVSLDQALREQLQPDDILFVFVRAPTGGPPLAIRRIPAASFPIDVNLSQADRMMAGMQIEAGATVNVGARISRSGQAAAQSGDLEAESTTITVADQNAVSLRIERIVP